MKLEPTKADIKAAEAYVAKEYSYPFGNYHQQQKDYLAGLLAGRSQAALQAKISIEHHYGLSGEVVVDDILRGPT